MAIVISGKTKCVLCGETILSPGDAVAFPSFIPPGHELSRFSDAAFHRHCFETWEGHRALLELYKKYREIWQSRPANLRSIEEIDAWGKVAFRELFAERKGAGSNPVRHDCC